MYELIDDLSIAVLTCPSCGNSTAITLTEEELKNLQRHKKRELLIQEALPDRDSTVRERFLSGLCLPCWNTMYGAEDLMGKGTYYRFENKSEVAPRKYLVTLTPENGIPIKAEIYAANAGKAAAETIRRLIGIEEDIPAIPSDDYRDMTDEGYTEPVYEFPFEYVVPKAAVSVCRLLDEQIS